MTQNADEKRMRLRYAGTCRLCQVQLEARTEAIYERATKTVRCLACATPSGADLAPTPPAQAGITDHEATPPSAATSAPEAGTAGASARREFERRRAKREERIRSKHPKLGGLILALSDEPQSTRAWDAGAIGEERLGHGLERIEGDTVRLLHDRRIPGSRANIDHVAVTPTGVYVIDAKRYAGKRPALRVEGGILRPRIEILTVGSRDQTKLVDGVLKQVELVRSILGDGPPVTGVLCFVDADWPLIGGAFTTRGVEVLWPKKLYARLATDGPHATDVADIAIRLADALPPA